MNSNRKSHQHTNTLTQTFADGYGTSQLIFDPEKELAKRTKDMAQLLRKIAEESEELDREKDIQAHQAEYSYNRIVQYRNDKARERSSEQEQRKLFANLKNRVEETKKFGQQMRESVEQLKNRNQLIDRLAFQLFQNNNKLLRCHQEIQYSLKPRGIDK